MSGGAASEGHVARPLTIILEPMCTVSLTTYVMKYVTPAPSPKYLGLDPALTVRTGMRRSPSALATSPPPHGCA